MYLLHTRFCAVLFYGIISIKNGKMFKSTKYLNWQNDQHIAKLIQPKQKKPSKTMLTKSVVHKS